MRLGRMKNFKPTNMKQWDVFISHASEDKLNFVEPLAKALSELGVKVWYDKFTLKTGDNLTDSIDEGLSSANFGVVIISPAFIKKHWTKYELQKLSESNKSIISVWHNLTVEEVKQFDLALSEKLPINLEHKTPLKIAYSILELARPDILENTHRRIAYLENEGKGEIGKVKLKDIKEGGFLHKELPDGLISRIRLIRASLLGAYTHSMTFWIDGFRRDAHPTKNIQVWENIGSVYREYVSMAPVMLTTEQHKAIFNYILLLGYPDDKKPAKILKKLPADAAETIANLYRYPIPFYDIEEELTPDDEESNEFFNEINIDKEIFPHDLPVQTVKEISEELQQNDTEKKATGFIDGNSDKAADTEDTEAWYERAAKSENDWVRSIIINKEHIARKKALEEIKKLQNSIANTLGTNHKEYGKVLLTLALYFDTIKNDRAKSIDAFNNAISILSAKSIEYAEAKKHQMIYYFEKKDYKNAEIFANESLQILQNNEGYELEIADMLIAKSIFRFFEKNFDEAIKLCQEALNLQKKKRAIKQINETKDRISYLMVQKKQLRK